MARFTIEQFNKIIDGLENEKPSVLRHVQRELRNEKEELKKYRRQELLALRKVPSDIAIERNTWFHLGINSSEQYIYCLRRMLEPIKEHVDNSFNPIPEIFVNEFRTHTREDKRLMRQTENIISTGSMRTTARCSPTPTHAKTCCRPCASVTSTAYSRATTATSRCRSYI